MIPEKYVSILASLGGKSFVPQINDSILLVDFLNLFIRSFTGSPASNNNGEHVGGITGSLYSLSLAIRDLGITRVIIASDGQESARRKRKIYPQYKEGRKVKINLNRTYNFKDENQELDLMKYEMQKLIQYLELMPIQFIVCDYTEADDVISYIAQEVFTNDNEHIYIMSSDKDYYQLINKRISVWSPTKKILYTETSLINEYGISPENFLFYRVLDGDKSDNIKGVKGVGLKSLIKFIPILTERREISRKEFLDYVKEKNEEKKSKLLIYKNILESEDIIELNEELMQLKSPNMSGTAKSTVTNIIKSQPIQQLNRHELRSLYIKDGLSNAIPDITGFLDKTFYKMNFLIESYNKKIGEKK